MSGLRVPTLWPRLWLCGLLVSGVCPGCEPERTAADATALIGEVDAQDVTSAGAADSDQGSSAGGDASAAQDGVGPDSDPADTQTLVDSADASAVDASPLQDSGAPSTDGSTLPDSSTPTDPPTSGGPMPVLLGGASADGKTWTAWKEKLPKVEAIFGPQGSHHIWVSACLPASVGTPVKIRLTLSVQSTQAKVYPGLTVLTTELTPLASHPGQLCRLALYGYVKCACTLANQVVRARVEVLSKNVMQGWAERSVQVVVPTDSPCPSQGKLPCTLQLAAP